MARITRKTKPARSSRGKSPKSPSIGAHMSKRKGVNPGSGIGGSPHGTSANRGGKGGGKVNVAARRTKLGYNV